jgi:hypothetical protein
MLFGNLSTFIEKPILLFKERTRKLGGRIIHSNQLPISLFFSFRSATMEAATNTRGSSLTFSLSLHFGFLQASTLVSLLWSILVYL